MKKIKFLILFFISIQSSIFAQITVTLSICGPNPFTLFGSDATGRNIYNDATSDYAIQWNISLNQWEIVETATSTLWYSNTFASIPNPPCASTGTWVSSTAGAQCGSISDITGDCQIILGLNDLSFTSAISVYPNPSNGQFYFTGLQNENKLEIYDMTGQLILKTQIDKNEFKFDLSGEAKGIYWYKITDNSSKIKTGKLTLQ